jgi:hypothetical protein
MFDVGQPALSIVGKYHHPCCRQAGVEFRTLFQGLWRRQVLEVYAQEFRRLDVRSMQLYSGSDV